MFLKLTAKTSMSIQLSGQELIDTHATVNQVRCSPVVAFVTS